jgi:hypothetical protein
MTGPEAAVYIVAILVAGFLIAMLIAVWMKRGDR